MKIAKWLFASVIAASVVACSSEETPKEFKKVIVFSSGKIDAKNNEVLFSIQPSNQHNEQEFDIAGKTSIDVDYAGEKITYDVSQPGYYIINFKKDTLVGGIMNFGDTGTPTKLTAADVDNMIDSTKNLLLGTNVSDEKRIYSILPKAIKKVGDHENTKVYGPFSNVPYEIEVGKDGKAPDVLKFYTNPQKRKSLDELLERLRK